MQLVASFLEEIRIGFISEIFWIVIGIIIGNLLNVMGKTIVRTYRRQRRKREIELHKASLLETEEILSLDHGDPYYELHDIVVKETNRSLYIGFPIDLKEDLHALDNEFLVRKDSSFDGTESFDDIATLTEIPELSDLIAAHKVVVAQKCIQQLREGRTLFNGEKYGVYRLRRKRTNDRLENAHLEIDLFCTDYFTHLVFRSIYAELKQLNHSISTIEKFEEIHKYRPFMTSFGMNTFVILDDEVQEKLIFSKRSKYVFSQSVESLWHVTMNEGLTDVDIDGKEVSLIKCLHRGLREELGIREEHHRCIEEEYFMDLFLEKTRFEIGLTSYVKMNMKESQLTQLYSGAKDAELETDSIQAVPLVSRQINQFVKQHKLTSAATYNLKMLLARLRNYGE